MKHKCGDIVTVYVDGFDRPWKGTGVITEIDYDEKLLCVLFKNREWWYEEKHLNKPTTDELKEALANALM